MTGIRIVIGIVLGAAYMLWMYQRVFFGPLTNEDNRGLADLNTRELEAGVQAIDAVQNGGDVLSSSLIRQRIREGRSVDFLVPPVVRDLIAQHGLYR